MFGIARKGDFFVVLIFGGGIEKSHNTGVDEIVQFHVNRKRALNVRGNCGCKRQVCEYQFIAAGIVVLSRNSSKALAVRLWRSLGISPRLAGFCASRASTMERHWPDQRECGASMCRAQSGHDIKTNDVMGLGGYVQRPEETAKSWQCGLSSVSFPVGFHGRTLCRFGTENDSGRRFGDYRLT